MHLELRPLAERDGARLRGLLRLRLRAAGLGPNPGPHGDPQVRETPIKNLRALHGISIVILKLILYGVLWCREWAAMTFTSPLLVSAAERTKVIDTVVGVLDQSWTTYLASAHQRTLRDTSI